MGQKRGMVVETLMSPFRWIIFKNFLGLLGALIIHWRYRKQKPNLIHSNRRRINTAIGCHQKDKLFSPNNSKNKKILKLISPPRAQRSLPCSPEKQREKYEQQQQFICGENCQGEQKWGELNYY